MIAMLGMYDMPAIQPANDRYWAAIRARLGEGPEQLTRDRDFWEIWESPDLLLGQTCGLPYRDRLFGKVAKIATPDYGLPGCPPGHYKSLIAVRADDPRGTPQEFQSATFTFNESVSQSGWAGPMTYLSALGLTFARHIPSGAHVNSVHAIAEGRADIAGIDALTWALLCAHDPVTKQLKIIGETAPTPGLPYITALGNVTERMEQAIAAAIDDLTFEDRAALHLKGLVQIPDADYRAVPTPSLPEEV